MATIIDYPNVLQRLQAEGFRGLYHNAGAFGFPADASVRTIAWIGADDPTIRDAARSFVRPIAPPHESTLACLFRRAWIEHLPGPLWVMPMSHWYYELHFGNAEWLPAALQAIDVDPQLLRERNDGAAIELPMSDWPQAESFVEDMMRRLGGSDFLAAFPGKAALCMLHHHKQLWWQTTDAALSESLDAMARQQSR
jgi:hypothetical protein